ncbi:MAG TPA: helix-turn-helix domain-containing protein [Kofleriaceae bacterium]|nr:helix-turn-helix domain-containing protein [Kofleriaceae bacterium]
MPKLHKWEDIREKLFTPAELAEIDAWVADEAVKINLAKIRELIGITQAEMAERLDISQSSMSRSEASTDPKLSTLRRHIEALGGTVEVRAIFGDRSLRLDL